MCKQRRDPVKTKQLTTCLQQLLACGRKHSHPESAALWNVRLQVISAWTTTREPGIRRQGFICPGLHACSVHSGKLGINPASSWSHMGPMWGPAQIPHTLALYQTALPKGLHLAKSKWSPQFSSCLSPDTGVVTPSPKTQSALRLRTPLAWFFSGLTSTPTPKLWACLSSSCSCPSGDLQVTAPSPWLFYSSSS